MATVSQLSDSHPHSELGYCIGEGIGEKDIRKDRKQTDQERSGSECVSFKKRKAILSIIH